MHNRWCIVSGPRTGSTWLERMIYQYWKNIDDSTLNLDEILDSGVGTTFPLDLNLNGNLQKIGTPIEFVSVQHLMDRTIDLLQKGNKSQPLTMKVFTQWRHATDKQYLAFLKELQKLNFRFINLNRILFDKSLSYYFMMEKGVVHKFVEDNNIVYSTTQGTYSNSINTDKVKIDFVLYEGWYKMLEGDVILQNDLCSQLPHNPVNYETMIEDCVWECIPHSISPVNIPNSNPAKVAKVYEKNYKEMIVDEDWKKLVDNYRKFSLENTACQFAWNYPVLALTRNELRNCCRASPNVLSDSDLDKGKDLFNKFIPIIKMKKELLHGIKTKACNACWQIEDGGGISQRSGFKNFVGYIRTHVWKHLSWAQVEEKLKYMTIEEIEEIVEKCNHIRMIELSLGNTCDLKCVYCNHHYSSQWAAEKLRYKEIAIEHLETELPKINNTKYEDTFWDWFESYAGNTTSYLNFIGGEPLLIDKFYTYTKRMIDFYNNHSTKQNKVCFGIVSNFNSQPKYFEKFKDLSLEIIASNKVFMEFNISAESMGERAEFIRNGTDWDRLTKNLENYLEFLGLVDPDDDPNDFYKQKICVGVQIAINSLSVSNLPDFLRYIIHLQKKYNRRINLRQNQVVFPEWCNPHILTPDYTKYIDEAIDVVKSMNQYPSHIYPEYGKWSNYITFLGNLKTLIENENKNVMARKKFVFNIDKLSERRKQDFHKTFPEMTDFYNMCKEIK